MRGMDGRAKGRRRRRGWKTAGVALLGLLGGSVGCQWTGEGEAQGSRSEPPSAVAVQLGRPVLLTPIQPPSAAASAQAAVAPAAGGTVPSALASRPTIIPAGGVSETAMLPAQASNSTFGSALLPVSARIGPDSAGTEDSDILRLAGVHREYHATVAAVAQPKEQKPDRKVAAAAQPKEQKPDRKAIAAPQTNEQKSDRKVPAMVQRDEQKSDRKVPAAAQLEEPKSDRNDGVRRKGKDTVYQVDRNLASPTGGMITPAIPDPEKVLPITLGDSLALAGVENPVIGLAEQAVRVSQAELLQASVLLLPHVNVGASYGLHNGPLQASFGGIRKVDRNNVVYGLGVLTVAAETIKIPGLLLSTHLGNAIYEPLIARQVVANRRFTATATRNQVLLEVSRAYLTLLGAEGRLAVIRQSQADFNEVVRITRSFARAGAGLEADANRAWADALALQYAETQAQEQVAVASADLARLLNLDPSTRLQTGDVPIQIVKFVDPAEPLPKLMQIAGQNRPELLAAAANIAASNARVRQEKTRPFYPLIIAGFSADDFGGGSVASTSGNVPNPHGEPSPGGAPSAASGGRTVPSFGRITGRTDVDVLALWTLQNFGFGNLARIRGRQAELRQAEAARMLVFNEVERQVKEAYFLSGQRLREIQVAQNQVLAASEGFQRDLERIIGGEGRPIEVLDNAKLLARARQELLRTIIAFDEAQFDLFVALGQPPTLAMGDDSASH